MRAWHDATAFGSVVLGDKENRDAYAIYNEPGPGECLVDMAEEGMAMGHDGGCSVNAARRLVCVRAPRECAWLRAGEW